MLLLWIGLAASWETGYDNQRPWFDTSMAQGASAEWGLLASVVIYPKPCAVFHSRLARRPKKKKKRSHVY